MHPHEQHPHDSHKNGFSLTNGMSLNGHASQNGATTKPAAPTAGGAWTPPNPVALLKALRRCWILALGLGITLGAAAAVTAWYLMPAQFYAQSLIQVLATPPNVMFKNEGGDFGNYQRMQAAMIKSKKVLNAALREPKVVQTLSLQGKPEPIEWLRNQLLVDFTPGPELMRIGLRGDTASDLPIIVNAVTEAYFNEIVHHEHKKRLDKMDTLRKVFSKQSTFLDEKRKSLKALAEVGGSANENVLNFRHRLILDSLARAQQDLMQVKGDKLRLQAEAAVHQDRSKDQTPVTIPESLIHERMERDREMQSYRNRMQTAEELIAQTKGKAPDNAPDPEPVKRLKQELEDLETRMSMRRKDLRPKVIAELREQHQRDVNAGMSSLQQRLAIYAKLEEQLEAEIKKLTAEARTTNTSAFDLEQIRAEIEQIEKVALEANSQAKNIEIELDAPARIRVLEEAVVPQMKDSKRQIMMAGLSGAGTFGLIVLVITLWEFYGRRLDSVDDVTKDLGLKLMGALPELPDRMRGGIAVDNNGHRHSYWQNVFTESVDATRTILLNDARKHPFRILMVTSALGGEGKTSLSCHLATSLARSGRRTLLVDFDLRRPTSHKVLGLDLAPGMSEALRGETALPDAVQATQIPNLWFVAAGQNNPRSLQAMSQEGAIAALFDTVREQYDIVVVDSCPILPVSDGLQVAQHVDAVIFSVLRDTSRLPKVHAAYQRLAMLGVRILGAVVNGANGDVYGYGYSRYQYLVQTNNS